MLIIPVFIILNVIGSIYSVFAEENNISSRQNSQFLTDNQLLDSVQYRTLKYFWMGAEPNSGMARERINLNNIYPEQDKNIVTTGLDCHCGTRS
jgi:hypothetical protein